MTTLHPKTEPFYIFERNNPERVMLFQFNPTEVEFTYADQWDFKQVSNIPVQTGTYKAREPIKIRFDMYLNEWAMHARPTSANSVFMSVEERIDWLDFRMFPRNISDVRRLAPPVLIFFWNAFIPVVITNMEVKRTQFRPATDSSTSGALQQLADIGLTNNNPGKITFDQGRPSIDNSLHFSPGNLRNDLAPRPNDAIEATVSITLMEYVESTAPANFFGFKNLQEMIDAGSTSLSSLFKKGIKFFTNSAYKAVEKVKE